MSARPLLAAAVVGAAALGIVACSPEPGDFRSNAESFINDSEDVSEPLGGVDFSSAECTAPASTDTGEEFTCLAAGDDGRRWQFTARIEGDRDYLIIAAVAISEAAPASTIGRG